MIPEFHPESHESSLRRTARRVLPPPAWHLPVLIASGALVGLAVLVAHIP